MKNGKSKLAQGKRSRKAALVGLLAGIMLTMPVVSAWAEGGSSLDLSTPEAITITTEADLKDLGLSIDIYQIAEASYVDGYDTYSLNLVGKFNNSKLFAGTGVTDINAKDISVDAWRQMAQNAVDILGGTSLTPGGADASGKADTQIQLPLGGDGLSGGLFLVIPWGTNIEKGKDGSYSSIMVNEKGKYYFEPMLIAAPEKPVSNETFNTADPGNWIYQIKSNIKHGFEPPTPTTTVTPTPTRTPTPTCPPKNYCPPEKGKVPLVPVKTGDDTPIMRYLILAGVSALVLIVLGVVAFRRRGKKQD